MNVLTWGTWGEDHFHMHQRVSAIINTILEHEPGLDVVALQEVNLELHNQLRSNKEVRKHWILTDFIAR